MVKALIKLHYISKFSIDIERFVMQNSNHASSAKYLVGTTYQKLEIELQILLMMNSTA